MNKGEQLTGARMETYLLAWVPRVLNMFKSQNVDENNQ